MQKIKDYIGSDRGKDVLTVIIVILVGLGSFGLGRLSKAQNSPGVRVEYPNELNLSPIELTGQGEATAIKANQPIYTKSFQGEENFFASNRGSKYYPVNCSAGKSLKVENRIYFTTREEAETAGYTLSSSCR